MKIDIVYRNDAMEHINLTFKIHKCEYYEHKHENEASFYDKNMSSA